jgi:hypothetical protein
VPRQPHTANRFNGFAPARETVKTVCVRRASANTPLKRGVNESTHNRRGFGIATFAIAFVLTGGAQPAATNTLTFSKDIAPIVFEHCAYCHRPGQAAPFSLLSYADVKKRSRQVTEVVGKRFMPPWLPEKGYGEFVEDRSLKPGQIDAIQKWVANGAPEGNAADLPLQPTWADEWTLGKPDLIVKLPQPYLLPAEGKDVYRNVVVPIPTSERKVVKGIEFLPGNPKVMHHAFVEVDVTRVSRRLAEKQNPPGFDGMALPETAQMPGGQTLGWQPGRMAEFAPDGLGWVLQTNTDLVIQMHLHPSGKPEQIQPAVGFYFTRSEPTNTAFRINLNVFSIDIPAGNSNYVVEDKLTLPADVDLVSIYPHAHYLAKRMEGYALLPDGRRQELLLIKDWDFNWQGDYRYARPVFLPRGTTVAMKFTYDNSAGNIHNPNQPPKQVRFGLSSLDEMAELWLMVLPRVPEERKSLGQTLGMHMAQVSLDYNEGLLRENPYDADAHLKAGSARMALGQLNAARDHFRAVIRSDPGNDKAWFEMGTLYSLVRQTDAAERAFEQVLRLNPDDYEAEGTLGSICLQKGDLDKAETHFRAALRLNPDDEVARKNLEIVAGLKAQKGK